MQSDGIVSLAFSTKKDCNTLYRVIAFNQLVAKPQVVMEYYSIIDEFFFNKIYLKKNNFS